MPPKSLTCFPSEQLSKQEDLIVWMRTAALPTFRKLYGRIYVDLKENKLVTSGAQGILNDQELILINLRENSLEFGL